MVLLVYLLADSPRSCLVSPSLFKRTHCWFRPIMLRLEVTLSQAWLVSSSPPDGPEEITAAALTGEGLTAGPHTRERGPARGGGWVAERGGSTWGWMRGLLKKKKRRGPSKTLRDERQLKRAGWWAAVWLLRHWASQRRATVMKDEWKKKQWSSQGPMLIYVSKTMKSRDESDDSVHPKRWALDMLKEWKRILFSDIQVHQDL